MLSKNKDLFCNRPEDIRDDLVCRIKIKRLKELKDDTAVQETYYSMPKVVLIDVKKYVADFLNKG